MQKQEETKSATKMGTKHILIVFFGFLMMFKDIHADGQENITEILNIKETDPAGTVILKISDCYVKPIWTVTVRGQEVEALYRYFTTDNRNTTYRVLLNKPLDLEVLSYSNIVPYDRLVVSISCMNVEGPNKFEQIAVDLFPVNEFAPVFARAPYVINVPENTAIGTEVFTLRDKTLDMDAGNTSFSFRISPYIISEFDGRQMFSMVDTYYGVIVVGAELDFESLIRVGRAYYNLNVTVTDGGGMASSASINVTVEDVNDEGIEFLLPNCSSPCLEPVYQVNVNESYVGSVISSPVPIMARDLDTLGDPVTFEILPGLYSEYFAIERNTGTLTKLKPLDNTTTEYMMYIEVLATETTNANHTAVANVTVYVEDRRPDSWKQSLKQAQKTQTLEGTSLMLCQHHS